MKQNEPDYDKLRPKFAWLPIETIRETFNKTTQYGRVSMSEILKKRFKSPNPALNVHRRNKPVAMDTIYSDVPAIDDGSICAQLYVGVESLVMDIYSMKSKKQMVNMLEDNIREWGAMEELINNCAKSEIRIKVLDILRMPFI